MATDTGWDVQEQHKHRTIVYKSYSKRAAALQSAALAAWREAAAAAREMRSELRALIVRARQRRLRAAIEKCAFLPPLLLQRCRWVELEGIVWREGDGAR